MENSSQPELVELTARIVSAYVSNNAIVASDLPHLISETHSALSRATGNSAPLEREEQKPKVPVKKSVMPDHIVCLEDGKKFKSLKRHLRTHYNLSPEEYRRSGGCPTTILWSLPTMPAPAPTLPRRWASARVARSKARLFRAPVPHAGPRTLPIPVRSVARRCAATSAR